MSHNIVEETSLVPGISKAQFDDVAVEFLKEYYPEALETPQAVPILEIAKKKMGLKVYTQYRLSEDFSIFGQMCFTSGLATIYDKEEDEYRDVKVRRGTMFIDPDTYMKRNYGCFNNTVSHECVHWYKHRNYHLYQSAVGNTKSIAFRCPVAESNEEFRREWDDEDWMEWQANGIAPRILMPKDMFILAAKVFMDEGYKQFGNALKPWWLQNKLAAFFNVSKQSAGIRMSELGISID